MVNAVIADLTYSTATLEGLEKEKENADLLVPIGGNSFVKAKLANPDKVIVGVGAGVSIEKTLPEAKEITKKRLDDLNKTRLSLQQQFTQVAGKINQDREQLEAIIAKARQEKTL
jgi:prefoldin alpha subunit